MSEEDVPPQVLDYLARHETLIVATASLAGMPHAATMVYANEGMAIFLWARPGSTTAQNAGQNPVVSFTIDEYTSDWTKTKGIQASGEIQRLLDPAVIDHAVELFKQKFAMLRATSTADLAFYQVRPTRLTFIDNESNAPGVEDDQQALGTVYRLSLVFSIFRAPTPAGSGVVAGPAQAGAGRRERSGGEPGRAGGRILHHRRRGGEVVRDDGAGPRTVATLRSGQFFGEVAMLREMPRSATVRAVLPMTLLTMAREDSRGLVAQSHATTRDFHQVIQERLDAVAGE